MSVPGIGSWLDILVATGQILIVPAYFENLGKRLTKSPRLYITDSGLACHLLGIESQAELERSPFRGALFEGFVTAEIAKSQVNAGKRRELYYFRDQQGLEVDLIVPGKNGAIRLMEIKSTRTPVPNMAMPMLRLAAAWSKQRGPRGKLDMFVAHRPARNRAWGAGVALGRSGRSDRVGRLSGATLLNRIDRLPCTNPTSKQPRSLAASRPVELARRTVPPWPC